MRAIVIRDTGPSTLLEPADLPVPRCGRGELLVRVHAAGVNPIDWKMRAGRFRFLAGRRFPVVLGFDAAGVVEEVGRDVAGFLPGDRVVVTGRGPRSGGTYAEYTVVPAGRAAHLPAGMTMVTAAGLPGAGCTALQALRDAADLRPRQAIMIIGASGGVGTFAVQIARSWGARVTAVCSGRNVPLVMGLGADRAIDYEVEDPWSGSEVFHVVFDAVAVHELRHARDSLLPTGMFLTTLPSGSRIVTAVWSRLRPGPRLKLVMVRPNGADLAVLVDLVHQGRVRTVLEKVLPLEQAAAAHALGETGRARGKIVLEVATESG